MTWQEAQRFGLTSLYYCWQDMKKRCLWKKCPSYPNYGGRGIAVCNQWKHSFSQFIEDMGIPQKGLTLERIDNNGDYEPKNCRWATHLEQHRNTRANHLITFNGETRCVSEWEEHLGLSVGCLWHRFQRGWSLDKALTTRTLNT